MDNKKILPEVGLVAVLHAVTITALFLFVTYSFFPPFWETNDDVGISMVAHGYGVAKNAQPHLVFSNVIWGYIVRAIPDFNNVVGYSSATLICLASVGAVIFWACRRSGLGWGCSILIFTLLFVRPALFPQFTINAGLLVVAAIICWYVYGQTNDSRTLIAGCLFAYFGYLIRDQEFLLVVLVALPMLPWFKIFNERKTRIAAISLVAIIGGSAIVNIEHYRGMEWAVFHEFTSAIGPIVDFGGSIRLKQQPDILVRHGFSINDIDLLENWFFIDPHIVSAPRLHAIVDELGPLPLQTSAWVNGWMALKAFTNPILLPGTSVAILFTLFQRDRKVLLIWALVITATFLLGFIGRGGVTRVYVPLVALLVIAPLLRQKIYPRHLRWLVICAVAPLAAFNAQTVFLESKNASALSARILNDLKEFPTDPVVSWGSSFPLESAFPVLAPRNQSFQLYSLGAFTLAPNTRTYSKVVTSQGLIRELTSSTGLPMIANEHLFGLLSIYCKEHLGGELRELRKKAYGPLIVSWRVCDGGVVNGLHPLQ